MICASPHHVHLVHHVGGQQHCPQLAVPVASRKFVWQGVSRHVVGTWADIRHTNQPLTYEACAQNTTETRGRGAGQLTYTRCGRGHHRKGTHRQGGVRGSKLPLHIKSVNQNPNQNDRLIAYTTTEAAATLTHLLSRERVAVALVLGGIGYEDGVCVRFAGRRRLRAADERVEQRLAFEKDREVGPGRKYSRHRNLNVSSTNEGLKCVQCDVPK